MMAFKLVLIVSYLLTMSEAIAKNNIPEVEVFFPEAKYDLSKVKWGHAINSSELLEEAINNSSLMMLETDVSKGHLINDSEDSRPIPIMAHPPHNTSDISLEMWIDRVIQANQEGKKIGVKLDFKDLDIVMESLSILRKKLSMITFPLWLNADILKGPGGENTTPIDADIFLSQCKEFFPYATLSLGWTTENTGIPLSYTYDMLEEMKETLERNYVEQPVTFPIRAAFVKNSIEVLSSYCTLLLNFDCPKVTIWTSASDEVNYIESLSELHRTLGASEVYFDLPDEQMEEMEKVSLLYWMNRYEEEKSSAMKSLCKKTLLYTVIVAVLSYSLGCFFLRK